MPGNQLFKSKGFIAVVICSFLVLILPVQVLAEPGAEGAMVGFVYGEEAGSTVKDAVVKIRNVENNQEYQSTPTDDTGYYEITNIAEGRYVLGVISEGKDYNFASVIYVKADETAQLSVTLKPGDLQAEEDEDDDDGGGFFASAFGIVVLALLGAGATIGTIALITGGDDTVSPSRR
jgi:hypothetical protein